MNTADTRGRERGEALRRKYRPSVQRWLEDNTQPAAGRKRAQLTQAYQHWATVNEDPGARLGRGRFGELLVELGVEGTEDYRGTRLPIEVMPFGPVRAEITEPVVRVAVALERIADALENLKS